MPPFPFRGSRNGRCRQAWVGALGASLLIGIASVLTASTAYARSDIRRMTCAQVNTYIQISGAIVLTITETRFARFVPNTIYCDFNERARPTREEVVGRSQCEIRYICVRRMEDFGR
jgi:hypothetical protein